jgi:hypothetical protein
MNIQTHRLIFNKSRGCLMVVGENARSSGGHGCSGVRRSRRNKGQSGQARYTTAAAITYTAAGAALNAGFSALAAGAAVSFVNNGGDIGKVLKDLGSQESLKSIALAMVSVGVLSELNAGLGLDKVTVNDGFTANLNKALINNVASAAMTSALTGASLEDSLKTGLVSAVISAGAGQAAFAIGGLTLPGTDGKAPVLNAAGQALAHALAGCVAGAAGTGNSQGCQSGAIGAVVGELAAQWVNPTGDPAKAEETIKVVRVLSAAAGALTGDGSAASVNTAAMTGVNAAENNWLATRQKAQMVTELNAASNSLEKAKVLAKYALISGKQDVLTVAGVGKGLAESGWSDIQGMAEFLSDPVKGLQGLQQLITDPQTRAALGDQIVNDFTAKIDRMNKALDVGGDANAVQLGQDLGSLVWQVGSVVTGVAGTAKAGAMLASAGVKVGAEVLENTALKLSAFNAGSIQGFKSAEAINAMMNAAEGWSPAWKPGTAVAEMTMKPGTTVKMVVDGDTLEKIKAGETGRAFGGWATFDDVPNQAYAREKLAITSAMKPDVGYVVELKITRPINAQVGVVGAQGGASGGGNQLHFLVNAADRSNVFEFVQGSGKALQ